MAKYFPGVSKRFGTDIFKMQKDQNLSALRYGNVIISIIELTSVQIIGLLPSMPIKPFSLTRPTSPTGKLIYGYNPSTNTYQIWNSLEKCTEALTGNRFVNKATVNMLRSVQSETKVYYFMATFFKLNLLQNKWCLSGLLKIGWIARISN
jgi:hypothetical protein